MAPYAAFASAAVPVPRRCYSQATCMTSRDDAGRAFEQRSKKLRDVANKRTAQLRAAATDASDALRGMRNRAGPYALELLQAGGAWLPPYRRNGGWNRGGGGGNDDDNGNGSVDPSWGAAPGAHILLRGRCDEGYRMLVANMIAMANSLPNPAFAPNGDPSVPLVIMLSWMGANQRSLAKYKSFYESMGYEVLVMLNGMKTAIFPPASKKQADTIAQVISAQPSDRPVFVHAFSIGTGIYGLFLDSLKHDMQRLESVKQKVVGVVFDSGPAPIFPRDVAKGLHTVCPLVSKAIWEAATSAFFFVTQARKSFGQAENALRKFQMPSPQLYFYSLDDKVIPGIHHAIEEFVEKNKQKGIEVYRTFWEKSVHATHLKVHPEEYMANLEKFVKRCMELRDKRPQIAAP